MSFLLAKISFLLLLAALFGGLFGWWLARRHFEDVTAHHAQLQDEWRQWRSQIERRLGEPTEPDWTPVMQRLGSIERAIGSIRLPAVEPTNLRPVLDAVASIRLPPAQERPPLDLAPVISRMAQLEAAVRGIVIPAPVHTNVAATDLQPLMANLLELQRAVAALHAPQE